MFDSYDRYRLDFKKFEGSSPQAVPNWLIQARKRGLETFNRLGFPTSTRGNEEWKYTNVSPIARTTFFYPFEVDTNKIEFDSIEALVPWCESWTRLVFVDGTYSSSLSIHQSSHSQVGNMNDAIHGDCDFVASHLSKYASVEDHGFAAINTAFIRDGALVYVPNEIEEETVLQLIFVTTKRTEPTVTYPRTLINLGANSKVTVIESYVGLSQEAYFTNAVSEIVVGDGAQLQHYRYLLEGRDAYHIGTTRVYLGRDSRFDTTSFARGSRLARNDLRILLGGTGASCQVNGLYVTSDTCHVDNHIDIDHACRHTTSSQFFKGILTDNSRAVFSGRVLIRKDAQKTSARQSDKNLILSEGARVNTKPTLEIMADDVEASHGATAGALPQDALFYMMSRGMDKDTAMGLLVHGFVSEIIDTVNLDPLRSYMDRTFSGDILNSKFKFVA